MKPAASKPKPGAAAPKPAKKPAAKPATRKPSPTRRPSPIKSVPRSTAPPNPSTVSGGPDVKQAPAVSIPHSSVSTDFEAGVLFARYNTDQTGNLTAEQFRKMWTESHSANAAPSNPSLPSPPQALPAESSKPPETTEKSEADQLNRQDYERIMSQLTKAYESDQNHLTANQQSKPLPAHVPVKSGALAADAQGQLQTSPSVALTSMGTDVLTGQYLSHYDETAGVALPLSMAEVHSAMGHSVVSLSEAYRVRYNRLQNAVSARLLPKREHLLQISRKLTHTSAEVQQTRMGIERETVCDTERILERLRQVESFRQSAISHQLNLISTDVEAIDRVIRHIEVANQQTSITDGLRFEDPDVNIHVTPPRAAKMVELIQKYADLMNTIEKQAAKVLNVQVEFSTEDFPRETSERLEVISRCDRYMHAIAVKDQMLWNLMQSRDHMEEQLEQERKLSQDYADEVAEWVSMTNKLGGEIQRVTNENKRLQSLNARLLDTLAAHGLHFS